MNLIGSRVFAAFTMWSYVWAKRWDLGTPKHLSASTLALDFQATRMKNKCMWFMLASLRYFITADRVNSDHVIVQTYVFDRVTEEKFNPHGFSKKLERALSSCFLSCGSSLWLPWANSHSFLPFSTVLVSGHWHHERRSSQLLPDSWVGTCPGLSLLSGSAVLGNPKGSSPVNFFHSCQKQCHVTMVKIMALGLWLTVCKASSAIVTSHRMEAT